jgi:hypothetical protein
MIYHRRVRCPDGNGAGPGDVIPGMRKIRIAASVAVACLALSACGQSGSNPTPTAPGGPSVTNLPTGPSSASPNPAVSTGNPGDIPPLPPQKSGAPKPSGTPGTATMTLTGTVAAGVEPNCLLLDNYLLVNGPRDIVRPGARVTVTGRVRSDLMTTCQQGTPFMVETAKAG